MASPVVWKQRFDVRAYEVDLRGQLAVHALCDWLQEAAGRHARALGWSVEDLGARGLTWVLSRLHLRLAVRPGWGTAIDLVTWPAGAQRVFAVRDFRASTGDGTEVAVATSGWLLMNLGSRRPVRPPDEIEAMGAAGPPRALSDDFGRLPSAESGEPAARTTARFSDLDVNRHTNNVALLRMVLDGMPEATLFAKVPVELEAELRAEVALGDTLEARVAAVGGQEGVYLHTLIRQADGREVVRARTRWVPAPEPV